MDHSSLEDHLRASVIPRFQHLLGTIQSLEPYGSGLINDTYKLSILRAGTNEEKEDVVSFILQRINHQVFTRPVKVMSNVERVTKHLAEKIRKRGGDVQRETLTLIPTTESSCSTSKEHEYFVVDDQGNHWRMYTFISGATAYPIGKGIYCLRIRDGKTTINIFREAGAAFCQFQLDLADLPPPRLHETIPGFGDSAVRFDQFQAALSRDLHGRAKDCQPEIQFCLDREQESYILPKLLQDGKIPERITHYDTKIDNVLIDDATGKGLCVIDLDTVMPGLAIYDFGDCVRTATALAAEDEMDLTKVGFSMEIFEWVAEGYLSIAKQFLTELEMDHLVLVARMVTFTMGLRFLADHLNGDVYYKTTRDNHNLDRARSQLKMVAEMEGNEEEMNTIIRHLRG
ncbi:unnamed protein product [Cylindrotheca closterium]|uniref:Aminoglycoside phosphotransferase domain-containing protein n=1 Tax=Cylindrotheca closterium TaxID=2856 RepID=A0AAD2JKC8_9STRA|nr:unnamed protein product [Cylindrotheca closterium]